MNRKRIFLVGRFNVIVQGMNEYLSQYFNVQLCTDNHAIIKGMLDITVPDMVLISLIGMEKEHAKIFSLLKHDHSKIPCLCVGTKSEQDRFAPYFNQQQFRGLTRPIGNTDLLESICDTLRVKYDEDKDLVEEYVIKRKSILVVDDNPIQLRAMKGILQAKYDVVMAVSGAEAMMAIGKRVPDLIFLDYEMPVCDGRQTLEMIRNLENAKDVPVVFLTGVRDRAHIQAVVDLKPAGYILKPTTDAVIEDIIKKTLGEKK